MGPRLISRGNGLTAAAADAIAASMGPRLISRGNAREEKRELSAEELQWDRG